RVASNTPFPITPTIVPCARPDPATGQVGDGVAGAPDAGTGVVEAGCRGLRSAAGPQVRGGEWGGGGGGAGGGAGGGGAPRGGAAGSRGRGRGRGGGRAGRAGARRSSRAGDLFTGQRAGPPVAGPRRGHRDR